MTKRPRIHYVEQRIFLDELRDGVVETHVWTFCGISSSPRHASPTPACVTCPACLNLMASRVEAVLTRKTKA